jgi:phage shock protein A
MTDSEIANHTYELLKRMNARVEAMAFDMLDIKTRMTTLEEGLASVSVRIASVEVSMTGLGKRLDRVENRLDRIERRLDLHDGRDAE